MQPFSLGRVVLVALPALVRYPGDKPQPRIRPAQVTLVHSDSCANVTVALDDATDANTKEDVRLLQEHGFNVHLNDRFAGKTSVTFGTSVGQATWPPFVPAKAPALPAPPADVVDKIPDFLAREIPQAPEAK